MKRRIRQTGAPLSFRAHEKPFIKDLFQGVSLAHQIPKSRSDLSTVAKQLIVACQRRWCGSLAVQEAAMYRRILLIAVLGLSLGACVPYSDGGATYSSEVYTSPAPTYYSGGGAYYSGGTYYSAPRYYQPAPRYYQPAPRYYQPPRYYQSYPNRGWQGHDRGGWDNRNRAGWINDNRGHDGGRDNGHRGGDHGGRGGHR
jgi:hypothetical protein